MVAEPSETPVTIPPGDTDAIAVLLLPQTPAGSASANDVIEPMQTLVTPVIDAVAVLTDTNAKAGQPVGGV